MIEYVKAMKGEAQAMKKTLSFLCPEIDYIEGMLNSSEAIVFLAKDNGNIIGVVGGWLQGTPSGYKDEDAILREHDAYNEAHLDWIAVEGNYREKGLGANLIQRVYDWARRNSKKKVWVESQTDNVLFYEKLGFRVIGRFADEKGEEYLAMLKQL